LRRHGLGNAWVTVAYGDDVVIGVEIFVAGTVVEPCSLAAFDLDRIAVEPPVIWPELFAPSLDKRTRVIIQMICRRWIE
jgi:hypothetical protein